MNKLSPSILSADFSKLGEEIKIIDEAGCDLIHVDVMDGLFVPSISYGMPVIKSIRKCTKKTFDVHLMVTEPIRYIKDFKVSGADLISVHVEACKDVKATLEKIREYGMIPAIALNPETDIDKIYDYIDLVDMILVMSVHPGFGGQKYIEETTEKIRTLRNHLNELGVEKDIEVDGGITFDNVETVLDAGANVIVAGSTIFKDAKNNTKKMLEILSRS